MVQEIQLKTVVLQMSAEEHLSTIGYLPPILYKERNTVQSRMESVVTEGS